MNISRKTILLALAGAWIIFSLVYIPWDFWNHFKNEQLNQAYNLGKADTINAAISQAKNTKCEAFSMYNDKDTVQLINTECLKTAGNTGANPTPGPTGK